ncbi:hypothetical protein [Aquiflexum lacus]|uniref:hypothetical protein n=1 Tax=Aquiflexum lacus TaxID=2483805 RepID=UPI00189637E0|nr:hypothetical protein [Aquiflexum lacus]
MISETQRRKRLAKKIQEVSTDKLVEIERFVLSLEASLDKSKEILSFAGSWKNIDDELFFDLTENLPLRREKNKRRSDE